MGSISGGDLKLDRSFGKGGTGGTAITSVDSPEMSKAARSRCEVASLECTLETSLLVLLRRVFPDETRPEVAEMEVAAVVVDKEPESRELVVGVPVYVVDDTDPRLAVK